MSKKSVIARDAHRRVTVARYASKRQELKQKIADPKIAYEEPHGLYPPATRIATQCFPPFACVTAAN